MRGGQLILRLLLSVVVVIGCVVLGDVGFDDVARFVCRVDIKHLLLLMKLLLQRNVKVILRLLPGDKYVATIHRQEEGFGLIFREHFGQEFCFIVVC